MVHIYIYIRIFFYFIKLLTLLRSLDCYLMMANQTRRNVEEIHTICYFRRFVFFPAHKTLNIFIRTQRYVDIETNNRCCRPLSLT